MKTVLNTVIEQCRGAMLAHIPILYIKTDSSVFIREIVDSDRLVIRLCQSAPQKYSYLLDRPYSELEQKQGSNLSGQTKPKNWIQEDKFVGRAALWSVPHIVTMTIEADGKTFSAAMLKLLNEYVRYYYDPNCSNRNILHSSIIILYSERVCLPENLLPYAEVIEVGYPEREEIRGLIQKLALEYKEYISDEQLDRWCTDFSGFRSSEIRNTMNRILTREIPQTELLTQEDSYRLHDTRKVRRIIQEHKQQKMQGSEVLKLIRLDNEYGTDGEKDKGEEIGGMGQLVEWIRNIADKRLLDDADILRRSQGIQPPRGILLCGIPGCGKSLAAKLTARLLELPLLQMDVGNLMAGIQGQSEENMRKALALAETMSPCILWIDELEKGFSGASGNSSDSTTFKRMFGTLLGWMQDNQKPCFIFATANDIGSLPKEFFRSGRFDELFAVYLPTAQECADIFRVCVEKAVRSTAKGRSIKGYDALFHKKCCSKEFYLEIVNTYLVREKTPRIVIGSDIQKIVNTALVYLLERSNVADSISQELWKEALVRSVDGCSVYGDGAENVESIAVGYCRMLRKGMKPTVSEGQALFQVSDYHAENIYKLQKMGEADEDEDCLILQRRNNDRLGKYDASVYNLLYKKINEIAPEVEKSEKDKMFRG